MTKGKKPDSICIFEDSRFPAFFPLSLNKPVFELFLGTDTLRARIIKDLYPEKVYLAVRPYLRDVMVEDLELEDPDYRVTVGELEGEETVFINGRVISYGEDLEKLVRGLQPNEIMVKNGVPVAARLEEDIGKSFFDLILDSISDSKTVNVFNTIKKISSEQMEWKDAPWESKEAAGQALASWAEKNDITMTETGHNLISRYWQLVGLNGDCIKDDFNKIPLRGQDPDSALFTGVELIKEEEMVIGSEVEVRSGTVLDATAGPIVIDDNVRIEPNAIINGPCFIGSNSIIRAGAKIGGGTSLGAECRVGGEVEETVISPYSNKQHEGFLGHSYIGSWVNIGAGSCNSDLKNNYSKVRAWNSGKIMETGRRFLGSVVGDHSKIAINSKIDTGTVIGFNSNIISSGFPPKFVPSFTWKLEPEYAEYELERAVETAELMMDRRELKLGKAKAELFKILFGFCRQSGHNV